MSIRARALSLLAALVFGVSDHAYGQPAPTQEAIQAFESSPLVGQFREDLPFSTDSAATSNPDEDAPAEAGTGYRLPDTGLTKCFSPDDNAKLIPCTGTQDGAVSINPLSYTNNGNGTVTDNNTRLIWQRQDDGVMYTGYEAKGEYHQWYNPDGKNVCGSLRVGGFSDWRLPTQKDLMSIVNYGILGSSFSPLITATYFPNTQKSLYWSSVPWAADLDLDPIYEGRVWGTIYSFGEVGPMLPEYKMYYVRCVRGGQTPSPALRNNSNGTATDLSTGLTWQRGETIQRPWAQSLLYCEHLSLAGQSDWRLPNVKELESLVDDTTHDPAINKTIFPNAKAARHWSSTSTGGNSTGPAYGAYRVDFTNGEVQLAWKDEPCYARCVRGGISGGDNAGPTLTVTSHANNQHVRVATITLAGAATDGGHGNSGIQKVTVGGVRAGNDTASGSGTANWRKAVSLKPGKNTIAVAAYDNSAAHNRTSRTLTIHCDLLPTVQFSSSASAGAEAKTPATLTVALSGTSAQTITVAYATVNGTAGAGADYAATSGTLTFTPGATSRSIAVPIVNDARTEADETFSITLSAPANAKLGARVRHTYTIKNDDLNGLIQLGAATYSVSEAGPSVTLTARRTGGSRGAVGVTCATANGTALAGKDYTAVSRTLTWADGDAADKVVKVPINHDALDEADEKFSVALSVPTGGADLALPGKGIVTIVDNDPAPIAQFRLAAAAGAESATPAVIDVMLSAASGRRVTVKYATANGSALAGSDYRATAGTLTFAPGQTRATVRVPIIDSASAEPSETFTVKLSGPVNALLGTRSSHAYTIRNVAAAAISDVTVTEGAAGTKNATFTVTLSGALTTTATVHYATADGTATAGSDYVATSGTLTFAAGQVARTISVAVRGDSAVEPDESFSVALGTPSGGVTIADGLGVGTIVNDDTSSSLSVGDVALAEGDSGTVNAVFTVTLSPAAVGTVTIDYATADLTATAGFDYTAASGTLSFAAGETSGTISVPVHGDRLGEGNEAFAVDLANPTGSAVVVDGQGVGMITSDEAYHCEFEVGVDYPGNDISRVQGGGAGDAYLCCQRAFDQGVTAFQTTPYDECFLKSAQTGRESGLSTQFVAGRVVPGP